MIHQSYNVISDARVEPVQCDLHRVLKTQSYEVNMQLLDSWHTCQAWNLETDGCIWSVICRRGKSVELMHPYHWLVKYTLYKVIREAELRATWVFQSGCWDIVFRNPAWSQSVMLHNANSNRRGWWKQVMLLSREEKVCSWEMYSVPWIIRSSENKNGKAPIPSSHLFIFTWKAPRRVHCRSSS